MRILVVWDQELSSTPIVATRYSWYRQVTCMAAEGFMHGCRGFHYCWGPMNIHMTLQHGNRIFHRLNAKNSCRCGHPACCWRSCKSGSSGKLSILRFRWSNLSRESLVFDSGAEHMIEGTSYMLCGWQNTLRSCWKDLNLNYLIPVIDGGSCYNLYTRIPSHTCFFSSMQEKPWICHGVHAIWKSQYVRCIPYYMRYIIWSFDSNGDHLHNH